jgi:hypothetical protein
VANSPEVGAPLGRRQIYRPLALGVLAAALVGASIVAIGRAGSGSAEKVYMEYRAAWSQAESFDPVLRFLARDVRGEIEAAPPAQRAMAFEALKEAGVPADIRVERVRRVDGGYVLEVSGSLPDGARVRGTVDVVGEDGIFRIKQESWQY